MRTPKRSDAGIDRKRTITGIADADILNIPIWTACACLRLEFTSHRRHRGPPAELA